jgi:hypothetical protein
MSLASPSPGDFLVWWPCKPDEPNNGLNWILRRRAWVEPDEVPIAVAVS